MEGLQTGFVDFGFFIHQVSGKKGDATCRLLTRACHAVLLCAVNPLFISHIGYGSFQLCNLTADVRLPFVSCGAGGRLRSVVRKL